MSEPGQTLLPEYFDALYTADPDPWKIRGKPPYERDKYALTLEAMSKPRYPLPRSRSAVRSAF